MARSRKFKRKPKIRKTKRKGGTKGILKTSQSPVIRKKTLSFNLTQKNDIQNKLQLPNNYEIPYPSTINQQLVDRFAAKRQNDPIKYWTNSQWCLYFTKLLQRKKEIGFNLNKFDNDIYKQIITSKTLTDEYSCAKKIYDIMDNSKTKELEEMSHII